MPLTDLQCLNAKPKAKRYKLTDENGLFLHIMPNGKRYWRYKYRIHGFEKNISFGQYPITSLAEAREKRNATYKQIEQGFDPLLIRAEEKQLAAFKAGNTFEPIAKEWFERNKYQWTERHAACILYRMERYIFPKIGKFPVAEISGNLLLACLEKISPATARRLLQYCGRIFRYAVRTGRSDKDPTVGVIEDLLKPKKGHVASIEIDALPAFLQAIETVRFNVSRQTYLAMQLMLLVFVRHKELRKAKKAEFNFQTSLWTIPGERMKMKLEHLVPLSSQAIAIIKELFELSPHSEYLLPSVQNRNKTISENTLLDFIYLAGYKGQMTVHGCRALATGIIQERLKVDYVVIDRQLAHVPESEVRKAYDRAKFITERTAMMQRFSDYVDNCRPNQYHERKNHEPSTSQLPNLVYQQHPTPTYRLSWSSAGYAAIGHQPLNPLQRHEGGALPATVQGEPTPERLESRGYTKLH